MCVKRYIVSPLLAAFICCSATASPLAYIANSGSNTVSVIDTATNTVIASASVGVEPYGVAVNASGTRTYVSNRSSNTVSVLDTASNAVVATIGVGASPTGIAVNGSGTRVYVANSASGTVSILDTTQNASIGTVSLGGQPFGVAINAAGTRVYVSNRASNRVAVIDAVTNTLTANVLIGADPKGIALNPSGSRLYVAAAGYNVAVMDTATNSLTGPMPATGLTWAVATNSDGTRIFARTTDNRVTTIEPDSSGFLIWDVLVGAGPGGLSMTPDGRRLYAVNSGSNSVSVIDVTGYLTGVVATIPVGDKPISLGKFIGPTKRPQLVEYRNVADFPGSPGGHFFYSSDPAEQAAVDNGSAGAFIRTGRSFLIGGTRPVCRFYGSIAPGPNSHFYTIDAGECNTLRAAQVVPTPTSVQQWNYEGTPFNMWGPNGSTCQAGTQPIYRAYNNAYPAVGPKNAWDSNHRFTPSLADIAGMVAAGWIDEGIAFCASN